VRLLIISATGLQTSDAPFLLVEAFRRAGHQTMLLPVDADLGPLATAGWRLRGPDDSVYRAAFQRRARKTAAAERPDAVVIYGSNFSLDPDTVRYLKFRIGAQVVLWEINQRIFGGYQARCMPIYDHVFCLDSYFVPVLRAGGLRCVEHLCAAADPREHRPVDLTAEESERYGCDVSFVGSYHSQRADCMTRLHGSGLSVRIYGKGWERAGGEVADWVSTEPVYGRKKSVVYSASRVVFHERGPHMLHGENFRVFEAGACGTPTLARPSPDLLQCFEPNDEVLLFDRPEEVAKVAAWWMQHPAALGSAAEAARRRVLAEHTYDHRAAVIAEHLAGGRHPR
jgi:spore maturation protein CgeB